MYTPAGKRCCTCKENKPLDKQYFGKNKHSKDGWDVRCKECKRLARVTENTLEKREYHKNWHLKTKYKLTVEDYQEILERQGGRCLLCRSLPGAKALRVDHDHACCPGSATCGKCIRGLLCMCCNLAMERIDADPSWAERAVRYAKQFKEALQTKDSNQD